MMGGFCFNWIHGSRAVAPYIHAVIQSRQQTVAWLLGPRVDWSHHHPDGLGRQPKSPVQAQPEVSDNVCLQTCSYDFCHMDWRVYDLFCGMGHGAMPLSTRSSLLCIL